MQWLLASIAQRYVHKSKSVHSVHPSITQGSTEITSTRRFHLAKGTSGKLSNYWIKRLINRKVEQCKCESSNYWLHFVLNIVTFKKNEFSIFPFSSKNWHNETKILQYLLLFVKWLILDFANHINILHNNEHEGNKNDLQPLNYKFRIKIPKYFILLLFLGPVKWTICVLFNSILLIRRQITKTAAL